MNKIDIIAKILNQENETNIVAIYEKIASKDNVLTNWLGQLQLLKGIPLNYLLPHQELLPKESIRFFTVDNDWLLHLKAGALSIGGHKEVRRQLDQIIISKRLEKAKNVAFNYIENNVLGHLSAFVRDNLSNRNPINKNDIIPVMSGLIIHSDFVTLWPGVHVDALSGDNLCNVLRSDNIAPNIRLYLFEGRPDTYLFYENKGALAYGFDTVNDKVVNKNVRDLSPDKPSQLQDLTKFISLEGVIDFDNMAKQFKADKKDYHAGHFAFQMIQGANNVVFKIEN